MADNYHYSAATHARLLCRVRASTVMTNTERAATINYYLALLSGPNLLDPDVLEAHAIMSKHYFMQGAWRRARLCRDTAESASIACQLLPSFEHNASLKVLVQEMEGLLKEMHAVPTELSHRRHRAYRGQSNTPSGRQTSRVEDVDQEVDDED